MKELSIESDKPMGEWSKSVKTGDHEVTVKVRQITNGYIIKKSKSWKDKEGNYQYEDAEEFSETNPLEEKEEEKVSNENKIEHLYKGLFGNNPLFNI